VRSIIVSKRNGHVIGATAVVDADSVILMSKTGQAIRIRMSELRVMGRSTQGVRLTNLKPEDFIVAMQKVSGEVTEPEKPGE